MPDNDFKSFPRMSETPKLIAFYLPQFYPFPENDEWWGKGFTEWTNVTRAQPLFEGHKQPHLPADLGFYDLRVRSTRREQIRLAKSYGIDGFCYHYYWFSGKRLLAEPVDDMLADAESDMSFCLCWANENWTRRWDAAEHEILIAQEYRENNQKAFIEDLLPYLTDSRYITVDEKPFLIVYRPQQIPDIAQTVRSWRECAKQLGIGELHLCAALTHGNFDYLGLGFDSGVEFPPHNLNPRLNIADWVPFYGRFAGTAVDYALVAETYLARDYGGQSVYKTVFPEWDNTARAGNRAVIVLGASPEAYEAWLASTLRIVNDGDSPANEFVFINAWNEWAEGCHLEPDQVHGHGYLEATLRAKSGKSEIRALSDYRLRPSDLLAQSGFWREFRELLLKHLIARRRRLYYRIKSVPFLRRIARSTRDLVWRSRT